MYRTWLILYLVVQIDPITNCNFDSTSALKAIHCNVVFLFCSNREIPGIKVPIISLKSYLPICLLACSGFESRQFTTKTD